MAAQELGLAVEIAEFAQTTRSAEEAAAAIGCEVGQIVKSLCFVVDEAPVIALVSGANRLDTRKLASMTGMSRKRVKRADADQVKAATGFSIGGVPPFGHQEKLPIYIDSDLTQYNVIWAAAGTPYAVFAITPDALVRVTDGRVGDLAA